MLLLLAVLAVALPAQTGAPGALEPPAELASFVEKGARPLAIEAGDLNGDGLSDYVLVLEKEEPAMDADGWPIGQRPLLVVVRGKDGLRLAKRNDKVVYCSTCGGVMGDPFMGVRLEKKGFSVEHYGGSAWRWSNAYTFAYSRRDDTWQLVRVENTSFHAMDPGNQERRVATPPRDFGKIDLADFDPDKWEGQGAR